MAVSNYELNLQDYLRILRKRKWIVFSFIVISFIFSYIYTSFSKPFYRSSTTIKVIQRETTMDLLTELMVWNPGNLMETAATTLTSYNILRSVAEKMGLIKKGMSDREIDGIVAYIAQQVSSQQVGSTNLIQINVVSPTPREAVNIAKYTAESYIEDNLKMKLQQSENVRRFVESQLRHYERELVKNEEEILKFKEAFPMIAEKSQLDSLFSMKDDPMIAGLEKKLVDQKLRLSLLLQEVTKEHPDVLSLQEEIDILSNSLENEKERVRREIKDIPEKQVQFARLLRSLELNKELYTKFRDRLEEVKITQAHEVEDVSIVEPPMEPQIVGTSRTKNIVTGVLLGTIFGLVLAFLRETLDTSIGTIEDVEDYLKLPVLGVVPHIDVDKTTYMITEAKKVRLFEKFQRFARMYEEDIRLLQGRLIFSVEHQSIISEAYRILQTNLQFTALDKNKKAIVVTSVGAGEGKTLTSINSAISMAQMGKKVLLVDCDYRRPQMNKILGLPREPGLSEVILGKMPFEDCVKNVTDIMLGEIGSKTILQSPGIENFNALTCGAVPLNPPSLLGSNKMDELVKVMKENYDVVIFDCAPVLPVTDTLIMASKCDTSILVYQTGRAARGALKRAKEQLVNIHTDVSGVVLNNISASEMRPSTTYYHYERKE